MNIITIQKRRNLPTFQPILRFQMRPYHSMEEVLRIAFRNFSYSLLRRCMLVSKVWRKIALDELQTRCSVTISNEDHVHIVLQKLHSNPNFRVGKCQITGVGVSLDNFFLHQTFSRVCHTLHHLKVESHVGVQESNLFALLIKLPNIAKVSVTFLPLRSRTGNHQDSNQKDQLQFPCLGGQSSSFKLEHDQNDDEKSLESSEASTEFNIPVYRNIRHLHLDLGQNVTFHLTRVFQVFPALCELAIANVMDEPRKHFKRLLFPVPLKHLMLRQYSTVGFPEKLVQTLMRFNMHLEKLAIINHPPSTATLQQQQPSSAHPSCSLLKQFIESQRNTLKSLKLLQVDDDLQCNWNINSSPTSASNYYHWNFNYSSSSTTNSLPGCISLLPLDLPNLETLHVQKPQMTNLAQVLNHFPKVHQLSIQVSRHGSNWKGLLPTRLQPHESVKKLEIDFIDSDSFSWLGYCFPFLQTLQLGFCDKTLFAVLCKLIPYFNSNIASRTLVSCHLCHGISHEFAIEQSSNASDEHQNEEETRQQQQHPHHHHHHPTENKAGKDNNESGNKESLGRKTTRKDTGVATLPPDRNSFPRKNINSNSNFSPSSFHHNESSGECQQRNSNNAFPETHWANSPGMIRLEMLEEQQGQEKIQRKKHPFKNLRLLRVRPCFHLPFEDFVFLQGHRDTTTNNQNLFQKNWDDEPLSDSPVGFSWTMLSSSMKDEKFEDFSSSTSDAFDETCSSA